MLKGIFRKFIKDRLLLLGFYIFNSICIITYYYLSNPLQQEIIYPFIISIFLLSIYLMIDFYRYYRTSQTLNQLLNSQAVQLDVHTEEQKSFQKLLNKITKEYVNQQHIMLEENQERIYFLSHWMHYLKTPVSVIELIASRGSEKQETLDVCNQILHENKRLHSAIEQGLTMLRIEKFENDLDIKHVDILASLRKIINDRKREFIYESIFPVIECEEEHVHILTDSKWNEMILYQVITNAIKYSSKKQGNKKLICQIERDGQFIYLSIIDEGIGIPEYDLERVFEPFFTGENGRSISNSSGIGLYLCKRIAEKLNHTIEINSIVSEGTTVVLRWQEPI